MSIKRYFAPEGKEQYVVKRQYKGSHARALYAPYGAMAAVPRPLYQVRNRGPRTGKGELKYVDLAAAAYSCSTTASVTMLNGIAVGDDNNNRDGRQIYVETCQIIGKLAPEDSLTSDTNCRIMLVWDAQPNGAAIAGITDILVAATTHSMTNLNNRERFTILRDLVLPVGRTDNTTTVAFAHSPTIHSVKWFTRIKRKTTYNTTTAAITAITTGALLLVTVGDTAAGSGANFTAATRVRFRDN